MKIDYIYQNSVGKWFATVSGEYDGAKDARGLETCFGEGNTKQEALSELLDSREQYL